MKLKNFAMGIALVSLSIASAQAEKTPEERRRENLKDLISQIEIEINGERARHFGEEVSALIQKGDDFIVDDLSKLAKTSSFWPPKSQEGSSLTYYDLMAMINTPKALKAAREFKKAAVEAGQFKGLCPGSYFSGISKFNSKLSIPVLVDELVSFPDSWYLPAVVQALLGVKDTGGVVMALHGKRKELSTAGRQFEMAWVLSSLVDASDRDFQIRRSLRMNRSKIREIVRASKKWSDETAREKLRNVSDYVRRFKRVRKPAEKSKAI